jgi:hypothetical protein
VTVERNVIRRLAIGATGLAVLSGAGVAYGVTQRSGNDRQAFLNDVAGRLNVTPHKLSGALKGAFEDRLDAAVKAGRLTQAQANEIKKRVERGGAPPILGGGPRHGFFHHGGPGGPIHAGLDAAASYLGLTDRQLFEKLRSGKSPADVAGDQNKSVDGLESAIKASVKKDLDGAVRDKRITPAQEARILSGLDSRLSDLVNRKGLGPRQGWRRGDRWGDGHPGGFGEGRGALEPEPGGAHFGSAPAGPPPGAPII